jgi:hypothetical protein
MITKEQIKYTPEKIALYIDGEYQFDIDNEIELNNVRIAACYGGWADRVMLKWQEREIGITDKADLTEWPNGMYDQQLKQFAEIVKWKRKKSTTYKLITN